MKIFLLTVCIVAHWFVSYMCSFYVFFRKSTKYDWLYFSVLCITVISWTLSKNECIISYFEKLCIDDTYVFNSKPSLPYVEIFFGKLTDIITFILLSGTAYNIYIMLSTYDVPWQINFTFIYGLVLYPCIKFRL